MKAERKQRLVGESKTFIVGLISHSLRINCVFLLRVIFLSIIYCFFIFIFFFSKFKYSDYNFINNSIL